MEDIRKTWFNGLSKAEAIKANQCLVTISDIGAIAGGPTLEELIEMHEASQKFKEIVYLDDGDVLDSFLEHGWCYGNNYIPESYFEEGESNVTL